MKDYSSLSDDELISLSKSNDGDAESELLHRYKTLVKQVARSYFLIGGETEDLVQEGMIALYCAIRAYNPDKSASFKTFAVLCVKRQLIDVIRRAGKNKEIPLSEEEAEEEMPENDELWDDVKSALSDDENKILEGYLRGLSYAEIAEERSLSVKKVDNDLQKIKKIIKKTAENNKF